MLPIDTFRGSDAGVVNVLNEFGVNVGVVVESPLLVKLTTPVWLLIETAPPLATQVLIV